MPNAGISSVLSINSKYFLPMNELKEGQIVLGNITELTEDSKAKVMINGKMIDATIVASTISKGKYYFEVNSMVDGQVQLKLVSEFKENDSKTASQILSELELPLTQEASDVVTMYLKTNRPITKNELVEILNILNKIDNKQNGLDTISFLLKKNLPLNKVLFSTMNEGVNLSLSNLLNELEIGLNNEINPTNQLQDIIKLIKNSSVIGGFQDQQLELATNLLGENGTDEQLKTWTTSFSGQEIKDVNSFKEVVSQQLMQSVKQSPILAKEFINSVLEFPSFEEFKSFFNKIPDAIVNEFFIANEQEIEASANLQTVYTDNNDENLSLKQDKSVIQKTEDHSTLVPVLFKNKEAIEFSRLLQKEIIQNKGFLPQIAANVLNKLNNLDQVNQLTKFQQQSLILNSTIEDNHSTIGQNSNILHVLTSFIESASNEKLPSTLGTIQDLMGTKYEQNLQQVKFDSNHWNIDKFPSLKEIALKALNSDLPNSIKEKIEQVVTKITSQQLVAIHQDGPQVQYTATIPLFLNNFETDLTVQWTGQEKNNQQIQSDYCKILFYLELETLKETMVDVSVQNRVIQVNIVNNHEKLNELIQAAIPILKENLVKLDFTLSSIKTSPFTIEREGTIKEIKFNSSLVSSKSYHGVDIIV